MNAPMGYPRYIVMRDGDGPHGAWVYADYDDAFAQAQELDQNAGGFIMISRHDEDGTAMTLTMFGYPGCKP